MILPSKHVPPEQSLLALGTLVLPQLERPRTVSAVWDAVRIAKPETSFDKFALTLSFLFAIGVVRFDGPLLRRAT